ncbi:MAG: glycosyltransferase family 39 protein [Proteobacteria bacterium]|nr:glycosyltransferase family 39 protein [Pseudomonadota bacterium]
MIATLLAALADLIVFLFALHGGLRLVDAHLLSCGVAFLLLYVLKVRSPAVAAGRGGDLRLHVHLLVVSAVAIFLRGAVLGLLTHVWGWSPQAGIVFAILVTLAVALPGYRFSLATTSWRIGDAGVVFGFVAVGFLLRLLYIGQLELLPEDSYYWNYSQHLDLGYLDHPPMVAWLIWVGTHVFGGAEFGVRIGAVCCAAVAMFFSYRLTRNLFGDECARVALVLLQVLPFFFLAGLLMTPDAPLTAAWSATLYFLERSLLGGQPRAWLFAGVSIGLGLISKYTIGMLVPVAFLFVLLDPQSRRWLLRWQPYAALLIASLIFSPVIIWNAQHEWASFAFQTSRRLAERPRFSFHRLLISALVLLTPTGFVTAFASRLSRRPQSRAWLFLQLAVLVPLSVFVVFSIRHDVKIDWTGALWLGAVPALAAAIVEFGKPGVSRFRAWLHSAWTPTAVIMMLLLGTGLHYLALGLPGVGYSDHLELVPVGWRDLGRQVQAIAGGLRRETGLEPVIVGMDRYELASQLTFYAPDHARSVAETSSRNLFGVQGLMYARWASSLVIGERPLLLLAWDPRDLADELTVPYASSVGPIQTGYLSRDGIAIRDFHYRIVKGYRKPPGAAAGND